MQEKKRALLSVTQKDGIEDFAKGLIELGFGIVSSGGTAKYLRLHGLETTDVSQVTGFPEILSDRVKTLNPRIHGGILALKTPEHEAQLKDLNIERFHLVCVDLYRVQKAIQAEDATIDSVIQQIDIGGSALIRGAAKNFKNVIVICDPVDRQWVLDDLKANGDLIEVQRLYLAERVFMTMAAYDGAIGKFLHETRRQ